MLKGISTDQRGKRQIVINNVENVVFHENKDAEAKLRELTLLESEIAQRISKGEASNLTPEEKRKILETGYLSGVPLSPLSGTLQGAAKSEVRENLIQKIYEARDNSDNLNLPDLLEGIGKFDSSTPADVLWKSSLSERENILNIIENLTSKLLQIGDKFSFIDRKKLLNEISENILLLQIKDFCPN